MKKREHRLAEELRQVIVSSPCVKKKMHEGTWACLKMGPWADPKIRIFMEMAIDHKK